jgi:hypothetical protein
VTQDDPQPGRRLEYADPYTPPPTLLRKVSETSPFRQAVRYYTIHSFAIAALLTAMASWFFGVRSLVTGSPAAGILGFVLSLAAAICVFIGDSIALPGPRAKVSIVAGIMAVGSLLFVCFIKVMTR